MKKLASEIVRLQSELDREIASRTEQYWCPIKHALKPIDPHRRYYEFLEYGDADGYRDRLERFREQLRTEAPAEPPMP